MLVNDLRTDRGVHRDRHVVPRRSEQDRGVLPWQLSSGQRAPGPALRPFPASRPAAAMIGRVHLRAGFLGHPEAAVGQAAFHVLAGPAVGRQLEIVDRRGAVQGQVGDDTAGDPRVDERAEPGLDDVTAEEQHDAALGSRRVRDPGDDRAKLPGGQDVRQAGEECGKRPIPTRRGWRAVSCRPCSCARRRGSCEGGRGPPRDRARSAARCLTWCRWAAPCTSVGA